MVGKNTAIVTGASQGIGAAVVQTFLDRGYNVVATSRGISKANFAPSPHLALVDGEIGQAATADNVAQTAIGKFGSINHIVNIRFNAVAPGQVDTPLQKNSPKEFLKTLSPMGTISDAMDIAEAVVYLTEARHVTGEVLHVDGGAHVGKW